MKKNLSSFELFVAISDINPTSILNKSNYKVSPLVLIKSFTPGGYILKITLKTFIALRKFEFYGQRSDKICTYKMKS